MNILHINKFHYLRGGAEAVYFNTAHVMEAYGHRSVFFSMHHPQNIRCETSKYFMPYVDLVNGNGLINQIKTAGRILYSFEAKKRLSKLLDEYPVDLAHLHNIWHHISPSILHELKKKKIPVVMTLHDYKLVCASYHLLAHNRTCEACHNGKHFMAFKNRCVKDSMVKSALSTLEMYLHHKILDIYDNVDVFISPSNFLKEKFVEMGFTKEIVHVPNFVDYDKFKAFSADRDVERLEKDKSIVYFGRLSHEKGLLTLLEAAKLLSNENEDTNKSSVKIKVIGDGPMRGELQEKVKMEGIKNVEFLGYMKGDDLFQEIVKSHAAILTSTCYENNPMSVIEAFASGIPVIGARIGGIPELVKDNVTGFTFQPGNAHDLTKKIKVLLSDAPSCMQMGKNARKFVKEELDQEKYYQRLMDVYKKVGF